MWFSLPAFLDWFVCFEFGAALSYESDNNGDDNKIFILSFDNEVGHTADARAVNAGGTGDVCFSAGRIHC